MSPDVLVVGAGAFGGWTALELVGRGARVTLVDAWGPGHVRSSSGGETRVIRASYGSRDRYSRLASRAFERWRRAEVDWRPGVFRQTGGLWMFGEDDRFGRASAAALEAEGLPFEWLTPAEAARRFPQIAMTGLSSVMFEPEAGYLLARRSCELVLERFLALGGVYRQRAVASPAVLETAPGGRVRVRMSDASAVEADAAVFACGPWLGALFPDVVGGAVTPTRQESYCFGTPPGDPRFTDEQLPVWLELRDRLIYGVPGNAYRGFKIADDSSGPARASPSGFPTFATRRSSAARCASTKRPRTRTSSSPRTRPPRTPGSPAAARATVSRWALSSARSSPRPCSATPRPTRRSGSAASRGRA
jgi:glycine/D-amino acid oxidase-like deaminating enzyme